MNIQATSKSVNIFTESNDSCQITVSTFLGTTVFKGTITPQNKCIQIKGLPLGKYTIKISNKLSLIIQYININN